MALQDSVRCGTTLGGDPDRCCGVRPELDMLNAPATATFQTMLPVAAKIAATTTRARL